MQRRGTVPVIHRHGAVAWRRAARQEDFATGFTEALIEYALGRPCGFSDEDLVKGVVKRAAANGFSIREFIHAVAQSEAFRSKRGRIRQV